MAELLGKRRPVMLGIPENDRAEQKKRDRSSQIGLAPLEPNPHLRRRQKPDRDAGQEEDAGIFAEQQEPHGNAGEVPPFAATALPDQRQSDAAQHPEQDRRRVRIHDDRKERGVRHHGEPQRRRDADAAVVEQDDGEGINQRRRGDHRRDRHAAHAENGVAEQRGAEPDQIGDHRRMVEIADRQVPRPQPVIGFVGLEVDVAGDKAAQRHHREQNSGYRQQCEEPRRQPQAGRRPGQQAGTARCGLGCLAHRGNLTLLGLSMQVPPGTPAFGWKFSPRYAKIWLLPR